MAEKENDTLDLEVFFEAARRESPALPEGLADRIHADALQVQGQLPRKQPAVRSGYLRQLFDALGGWPAMGGLATACAAGIWLGFSPPLGMPDPAQLVTSEAAVFEDDSLVFAMAEEG